jgi:hypothetical protein
METKVCTKCEKEKSVTDFYFRNKSKNKRRSDCKVCCEQSRKSKEHYEKYKDEYKFRNKERKERLLNENTNYLLSYLKEHHCVDCGESNPIVLEFDHIKPNEKEFGISKMMRDYTWDQILKEIDKCEVVCANCHKIRTAKQFGWLKLKKVI